MADSNAFDRRPRAGQVRLWNGQGRSSDRTVAAEPDGYIAGIGSAVLVLAPLPLLLPPSSQCTLGSSLIAPVPAFGKSAGVKMAPSVRWDDDAESRENHAR